MASLDRFQHLSGRVLARCRQRAVLDRRGNGLLRSELVDHLRGGVRPSAALAGLCRVRRLGAGRAHRQYGDAADRGQIAVAARGGGEAARDRRQLPGQFLAGALHRVPAAALAGGVRAQRCSPRTGGAALALPGKAPALRENTALARTRRSPLTIRNALAKASRLPTFCTSTCASTQSPTFGAPAKSAHTLAVVSAAGGSWLNAAR